MENNGKIFFCFRKRGTTFLSISSQRKQPNLDTHHLGTHWPLGVGEVAGLSGGTAARAAVLHQAGPQADTQKSVTSGCLKVKCMYHQHSTLTNIIKKKSLLATFI